MELVLWKLQPLAFQALEMLEHLQASHVSSNLVVVSLGLSGKWVTLILVFSESWLGLLCRFLECLDNEDIRHSRTHQLESHQLQDLCWMRQKSFDYRAIILDFVKLPLLLEEEDFAPSPQLKEHPSPCCGAF